MKERPILFSGEMVRAILEGRKAQTRRVIKPQPDLVYTGWDYKGEFFVDDDSMKDHLLHNVYGVKGSPYGSAYADGTGDLLWVRETWCLRPDGYGYRADNDPTNNPRKWGTSRYMPRRASRITLRVVDVRVERLQEISDLGILAEGIPQNGRMYDRYEITRNEGLLNDFRTLWDSINAARGFCWNANPWVWVVEFERVQR
jgi:hypothetical protein